MASNFPTSLDAFTNPSSTDSMDSVSVPHATQHADLNDAVEALQAKVGANGSAVASSHDYKIAQLEAGASGGKILQVVQTVKTNAFTTSSTTSEVDITDFSVSITPTSTSSKILVDIHMFGGEQQDAFPVFKLYRDTTVVVLGDSISPGRQSTFAYCNTGNNARDQYLITPVSFKYLDSPSTTSQVTYKVSVTPMSTVNRIFYLNRPHTIGDANQMTTVSTITVMEVAG